MDGKPSIALTNKCVIFILSFVSVFAYLYAKSEKRWGAESHGGTLIP